MFSNRTVRSAVYGAISLACAAPAALAETGGFSFALRGAADTSVSGDVHGGATLDVPDLGAVPTAISALDGVPGIIGVESRAFDDIYDTGWTLGGEMSYGYTDATRFFVSLDYTRLDAGDEQVGSVTVPALGATLPLRGDFGDYEAWSAQVGMRYRFANRGLWTPFVGGRLGATRIESIEARFFVPFQDGNAVDLTNVPFFDSSTAFTGGIDFGLDYEISDTFGLGLIASLQYVDAPDGDDAALGGLGLGSINDEGERWSLPVGLRARWTF